jgi:hypothetical protein
VPENVPRGKDLGQLRRHSLPALHLQEDQSAAMMSNPPVFTNPLRRRGCCDHQHSQQVCIHIGFQQGEQTMSDVGESTSSCGSC